MSGMSPVRTTHHPPTPSLSPPAFFGKLLMRTGLPDRKRISTVFSGAKGQIPETKEFMDGCSCGAVQGTAPQERITHCQQFLSCQCSGIALELLETEYGFRGNILQTPRAGKHMKTNEIGDFLRRRA